MGPSHDAIGIDWVRQDIAQTLQQAEDSLKVFLDEGLDKFDLQACRDCVHQVHGSLQMVGLPGAARLTRDLEQLLSQLLDGTVQGSYKVWAAIAQALLHLPRYLNNVVRNGKESPLSLMRAINDIRVSMGALALSQRDFFDPPAGEDLPLADEDTRARYLAEGQNNIRKVRQVFQFALIKLIRNEDIQVNLNRVLNSLELMRQCTQGSRTSRLWDVAAALVEGLINESIALNPDTLELLRKTDGEIKLLADSGMDGLDRKPGESLLNGMLYFVAGCEDNAPHIQTIKNQYHLSDYSLSETSEQSGNLSGPDVQTMETVVALLKEDLEQIKDTIDLYVRSEGQGNVDFEVLGAGMRQVASTLEILDLEVARSMLADQLTVVVACAEGQQELSSDLLLQMAESILFVEAELDALIGEGGGSGIESRDQYVAQATDAVIAAGLANLQQVKGAIYAFIAQKNDYDQLEQVPALLREAYGNLLMISLNTAGQLVFSVAQYVEDDILAQSTAPTPQVMDTLAEIISRVEHYLEKLAEGQWASHEDLNQAKAGIASLGYPVDQLEGIISDVDEFADAIYETEGIENIEAGVTDYTPLVTMEEMPEETAAQSPPLATDAPVVQEQAQDLSTEELLQQEEDQEILEIFVEEVGEVFEEIDQHWPLYSADTSNIGALKEVRRGFHTLKGCGRMVQAGEFSELAWSIEHLLNQMLESGVNSSPEIIALVEQVRERLPGLLEQFKVKQPYDDVGELMRHADCLAAGEPYIPADIPIGSDVGQPGETISTEVADEYPSVESFGVFDMEEDELHSLFIAESRVLLRTIGEFLDEAQGADQPVPVSDALVRAFHTLKGSAYTVALEQIGQVASAAEQFVRTLSEHHRAATQEAQTLLAQVSSLIADAIYNLPEKPEGPIKDHGEWLARIEGLSQQMVDTSHPDADQPAVSPTAVFLQENMEAICATQELFEQWRLKPDCPAASLTQLRVAVTDIAQASKVAELPSLHKLAGALADSYATIDSGALALDEPALEALCGAHEGLLNGVDRLTAGLNLDASDALVDSLHQAVAQLQTGSPATTDTSPAETEIAPEIVSPPATLDRIDEQDQELADIFLEEAEEIIDAAAEAKQRWMENPDNLDAVDELQRCLHTLKGGSRMAGVTSMGDLSHAVETLYQDVNAGKIKASESLFELLHESDDRLMAMLHELKSSYSCTRADALVARIKSFHQHAGVVTAQAPTTIRPQAQESETLVFDTSLGGTVEGDAQQIEAFFKDAEALFEQLAQNIKQSADKDTDKDQCHAEISRLVTELNNQSLTAGIHEIGDLCQIFMEVVKHFEPAELADTEAKKELSEWLERIQTSFREAQEAAAEPLSQLVRTPEKPQKTPEQDQPREAAATQETVRVSSILLENLVDLAGETSVSRSRIEQQISNFRYTINEMDTTIDRLREQLRRLDRETEAQILFRQEREGPELAGFDSLEMDRYSRIQELSRGLVESASDLVDLKETLLDRTRYTENLLLAQSRINTELQEGLMKTRMVPFSRMVPRLRRVVRQISSEVGKQVELRLKNVEAEMDRTLLEHMTAPLEHMLRNAVDHGIESIEQRKQAGKPEKGVIELYCGRDGGDVVLRLSDDGAGVDIDTVRNKAIERNLMAADAGLSDREILQFILHAGFSTAKKVTQISGRGVGMDVVLSEIKRLNGSIEIDSTPGKGSVFTIRLPFTVAMNRALMVTIGEDVYALPLNSIEGVVRVSPYELEEYYQADGSRFEYAGQSYDLHYLGDYLGLANSLQMKNQSLPLPVLLVRTAEKTAAIQVDSISGSREIVVKSLGPQLGAITGMSGATILGDGRVVLILDIAAMVRSMMATRSMPNIKTLAETKASENLLVMVVDDSVTVRKVASRILQRNGMDVIVAKDGVEAVTKLQDTLPDLMLLDIEMPRMDGFELAALMRNDDRLSDIPIIMVTSRTGQKHRDRATEIGVDCFMGKPFQEAELLQSIARLTSFEVPEVES